MQPPASKTIIPLRRRRARPPTRMCEAEIPERGGALQASMMWSAPVEIQILCQAGTCGRGRNRHDVQF
jgi:hypothetical protein